MNVVTWQNEGDARVLSSVEDIQGARAAGELAIERPGAVVNMRSSNGPVASGSAGTWTRTRRNRPATSGRPLPDDIFDGEGSVVLTASGMRRSLWLIGIFQHDVRRLVEHEQAQVVEVLPGESKSGRTWPALRTSPSSSWT